MALSVARPHLLRMVSRVTRNHAGTTALRNHVHRGQARYNIVAQQCVQADLVVRAALEPPSRRGAFFRFVIWFPHQAANASRWAALLGKNMRVKTLCIFILLLSLASCKPVVFDSLPQTPTLALAASSIPIVSTVTFTSTPVILSSVTPEVKNISDYYGIWTITSYEQHRTGGPFTEEDAKSQIGKTVELSSSETRFENGFLWRDNNSCAHISYAWSTPDDFVGHLWQALLPTKHPEKRDQLWYLKVNCDGSLMMGFEVTKTRKLVAYSAFYWFFLDRGRGS